MTDSLFANDDNQTGPRGKTIGFLESVTNAGSLKEALSHVGVADTRVDIYFGTQGLQDWDSMMGASTWGEQAEKLLKQGVAALEAGQAIFAIRVADRPEAARIADIAKTHGAHGVTYFGELVDTVLTA